jgi:hypothetical protein
LSKAFVGAYWGARAESVEACADRVARFLPVLAAIDPLLSGWRDRANTQAAAREKPIVTTNHDDLVERLLRGVIRDDRNKVIESSGYSVNWWNGRTGSDGGGTLNMTLGRTSMHSSNVVVLNPPGTWAAPQLYTEATARSIAEAVIEIFEPERAVWLDDDSREMQREPDRVLQDGSVAMGTVVGDPAGWATYLADSYARGFEKPLLPAKAVVERVGSGNLVILGSDPANPPADDILAVRAAMGYGVPPREQAPAASADIAAVPGPPGAPAADYREKEVQRGADARANETNEASQPKGQPGAFDADGD